MRRVGVSLEVAGLGELFAANVTREPTSFVHALLVPHEMVVAREILLTVRASVLLALMLGLGVLTSGPGVVELFVAYLTRKFLPFVDHVDVILQVSFVAKHLITDVARVFISLVKSLDMNFETRRSREFLAALFARILDPEMNRLHMRFENENLFTANGAKMPRSLTLVNFFSVLNEIYLG